MPELPEVQTVVTTLAPFVAGAMVRAVDLRRADILTPLGLDLPGRLHGRRICGLERRGKRIVFTLDDGNRFYIHLGMTGRLTAENPESPRAKHTHLIITTDSVEVRFRDPRRFGGVFWLGSEPLPEGQLGPEPLGLSANQLGRRLAGTKRAIKAALLDQTLVAGLGNIYADESLFRARIHPERPANGLLPKEVGRLSRSIKLTLRRAIRMGGSSINDYVDARGTLGKFQDRHQVYQRHGRPCPVCGTTILRLVLGGRSTHFCPKCQQGKRASLKHR